ncbi:MAG: SpoIVB peptidase [Clostridiales bacterium GWE2_32_10]|nr:MAG: SpoIVB peptidase [Clostridiales bacterium GWE2_32_10]
MEKAGDKDVTLKINRKGNIIYEKITPILSNEDEYKIGIWVRDSTQGIGTITYYNPSTGNYGALGHGIVDVDTSELMTVRTGKLLKSNISCIKKGERGTPGELMGIIIDTARTNFGSVIKNTGYGIFGKLNDRYKKSIQTPETDIALKEEIKLGKAYIYSDVLGDGIEKYEIEIQSVNTLSYDISKGVIIKITDKRLLEATNGIVQGMSGSPIIQNGKIIGAVTHVFVNDPTKGYGIFIENMLKEEKKI